MKNRGRFSLWLLQIARLKVHKAKMFLATIPDCTIDKIMAVLDEVSAAEVSIGTTTICDYVIPDFISEYDTDSKEILFFRKIRRKAKQ